MKLSESLHKFLNARKTAANTDLIDRWAIGMETQVNVRAANGEPVSGKRTTFSDGINTWWNIRIPHGADTEPEWSDYDITWPLDLHADGIGCTGWQWQDRVSLWVAFDFDGISGHAKGVGISDEDLEKVKEAASPCPTSRPGKARAAGACICTSTSTASPRRTTPSTLRSPGVSWE